MVTELYKEEDSRVYNIGVLSVIHGWMDLRHGSSSETARFHKGQSSDQDKLAGLHISSAQYLALHWAVQ